MTQLGELEQQLVLSHTALAKSIARKVYDTAPHALELEELRAIAYAGLVDAAARWRDYCTKNEYDYLRIAFFTKYSSLRIRGEIYDRLRSKDWATRSLREKSKKINKITASTNGADFPSVEELAEQTGLTEKEVRDTITGMSRAPISLEVASQGLDTETGDGVGLQLAEAQDVESAASVHAILCSFADAVRDLPFEERLIIVLHYHQQLELKKAAALLDITDAQASTLHTSAVLKLLSHLRFAAE